MYSCLVTHSDPRFGMLTTDGIPIHDPQFYYSMEYLVYAAKPDSNFSDHCHGPVLVAYSTGFCLNKTSGAIVINVT